MDKYTVELYDWIATQDATFTKDVSFADFDKKISTDENYAKSMYNWISSIDNTFSSDVSEQDFLGRVKKKEDSQPVSVEESMVSTTGQEEYEEDGLSGSLFQPSVEELKADPNIQLAMQKGLILESDFEDYLKDLQFQGAPEMRKTGIVGEGRDPFFAKKLLETYKTKTKDEIRKEVEDLELDNKSPYRKSASGDDFVENVYSTLELARLGIDYKDFDGFLEENGYKKEFLKNEQLGIHENDLTRDMNKSKYLNLYVQELTDRNIAGQQLKRQYETGLHPDFMDEEFAPQTGINYQGLSEYRAKNMPALQEALIEKQRKLQDKYKEAVEQGDLNIIGETSFWRKASDRLLDVAATGLDKLGSVSAEEFSMAAEELRAAKERREFKETPLHYATVSGKKVDIGDEKYIVSDDGQIYDVKRKINITSVAEESLLNEITEKAKTSKERDRSISFIGMSIEGANVAGDLVGQVILQAGIAKAAGRAPMNVMKTPISRELSVAMVAQGTLGYSMGYEETLKQARAAGIKEEEARELASTAAVEMGALYAMTGIINPRTKAVNAVTGVGAKVKQAVEAYKATGSVGFKKAFTTQAVEFLKEIPREGVKELVQENIQQAGEMYGVNPEINKQAGKKILKDTITLDEFITTSVLSFAAGGLMPGAGSLTANIASSGAKKIGLFGDLDELQALDLLSKNRDQAESVINMHVKTGAYTQQQAKDLLSDIDAYSSTIESIPKDITAKQKKQAIQLINEIRKAEQAKAQLDPAFHENVDKQIAEKREQLKNITQQEEQEELFVTPTPDVVDEVEETVEEETPQVTTQPKPETVQGVLNRPITLTKLGGSNLDTPIEGNIYVEGQQVVVEDADGNLTEIGNVDEISQSSLEEMGIEISQPDVTPTQDGKLLYRKKGRPVDSMGIPKAERAGVEQEVEEVILTPDKDGIKRNKKGDVTRVTLKDQNGQDVTLRGANAEEAAYQILLSEAMSPEQSAFINEQLENDEEFQNELRKAAESAQEQTDTDTEQTAEPTAEPTEEIEEDVVDQIDRLLEEDEDGARAMVSDKKKPGTIEQAIANVKKALKLIAPDVKIEVYKTTTAFIGALEARGLSKHKGSLGLYDPKTNTIYIDAQSSDAEVVYHEAFHAMLSNTLGTNENIKATINEMIDALRKVLPQDIINQLDEDLKAYADNRKDEEFITHIFGQLTEAYRMVPDSRSIIKKFLDKLAKLLGLKEFTTSEVIDVLNTLSGKMARGEQILEEDINFLGLSGTIEVSEASEKSSLVGKIDLKRFPVNKNSIVRKNFKLKKLNGKRSAIMESDRMTGAYVPDAEGNPMFKFFGGLFYPVITGNMWSSSTKSKAEGIAKSADANRDKDGYAYLTPLIMKPGSHMSNRTMFAAAWHVMKYDLKSRSNKVTKAKFLEYLEKALSQKGVNKSISDFGVNKSDTADVIIDKLAPFMESESEEVTTFDQRKAILRSILGTSSAKTGVRFPSAGTFLEFAGKFEEELTRGRETYDFSVMYRTKGNLEVVKTTKDDEAHHDSYEWAIKSDDKVEILILDKTYNVSKAIPSVTTSGGKEFSFDDYKEKYDSEKQAVSQYGIWGIRGFASGEISAQKATAQYGVNKAKDAGFSEADIRKWGNSKGFTTAEINDAINKYEEEKRFKGMQEEGLFNPKSNFLKRSLDKAYRKLLSSRGFLGKSTQKDREAMNGVIEANIKNAITTINDLNKVLSKYKNQVEDIVNNLDAFLRGDQDVELPEDVREVAVRMRAHVDGLSKQLVEVGLSEIGTESYATIMSNIGSYLNRSYEVFDNPNYTPSDEIVAAAKNYLRNAMRGKAYEIAMQENNDPITVLEEMVDREVEKILNKNLESDYKNAASKVGAKKTSLMDRRLEIPFEIRALMGEYTDPAANYARSVKNIVQLVESHRFTNRVRKAGEGIFLFDKPTGEYNVLIASEGSRSLDPLNGMYTTQEIYDALQNRPLISFDNKILNSAYEYWLKSVGTVKYSKTILSIGTHAKNVFGNLAFMMYNGYFNPADYNNAYNVVKNDFLGQTSKEQREKLDEYIKAGIISQSVTLQEIRSMFSGDDDFDVKLTKRHQDNGMTARIKRATKKGASKIADLYQAEDDFFKIVAYEAEKRRYADAFHSKAYADLDQDQKKEVDDYVAEIVKNILPNYSRIGQIREIIRAVPLVGTFISFEMEAWRTAYNTVKLASDEIKDPRTRSIGRNRMLGIMAVSTLKAMIYSSLGLFGGGEDDEDENSFVDSARQFMPPWAKNSNVVVKDIGEGKFKYINVSASDPHGSLDEVLISFLRGDTIVESFTNAFTQFSSPFFSSDILAGAAMEILRNEDSVTGKPIYLETDTSLEATEKILARMWKAIEPGTLTSINKIYESETPFNEFTGQVSGLKSHEVEIGKQTFFRSRDISNRSRVVVRDYTSGKYRYKEGKIDRSELNALYTRANENHKEVYGDLLKLYEAGLKLGASRRDMVQSMKDGGVPMYVIRGIVSGRVPNLNR